MCNTSKFRSGDQGENTSWWEAISDGPFRFRLGTRPADARSYFAPTNANAETLAERQHWLETDPERYAALLPEGTAVLNAMCEYLAKWQRIFDAAVCSPVVLPAPSSGGLDWERCLAVGKALEPDFALLRRDASARMVLVGGCVCFPTNWRLSDKIGQPIRAIHDVVPGLTAGIGAPIDRFLARMKPDGCWARSNWGFARTCDRNQHPDRGLPKLTADAAADEVWLRIEEQALVPLAEVDGLLFGIRVRHIPLVEILPNAEASRRLRTAIETMSPELLQYKNLAAIRDRMLAWLRDAESE